MNTTFWPASAETGRTYLASAFLCCVHEASLSIAATNHYRMFVSLD
jgi:hypothetical protein